MGALMGAIIGLAAGGAGGFFLGRWLRCRARFWYWTASVACLVVGVVLIYLGQMGGLGYVAGGGLGLLTGGLNGIKYGTGRLSEWRGEGCGDPFEEDR
jgi:hypothetical protein